MNRNLKVVALTTISLGILFGFIALVSSHWINTNSRYGDGYLHMGLWKACKFSYCDSVTGAGYAKALLILAFIFGLLVILMAAASLYVESQGPVGVLNVVAWTIFFVALLQLFGMVRGTIVFHFNVQFGEFSWAYGLGWISVILCFTSAIICGIDHKLEPKLQGTLLSRFSIRGRTQMAPQGGLQAGPQGEPQGEDKPPAYSPPQGAISPYPMQNGAVQTYQTPPMTYEPQMEYQVKPGFQP